MAVRPAAGLGDSQPHRRVRGGLRDAGGVRGGLTYGRTDGFGFDVVENPVHVHDFHATLLHPFGLDHFRLTYPAQGREMRLTDVAGNIIDGILG